MIKPNNAEMAKINLYNKDFNKLSTLIKPDLNEIRNKIT